MSISFYKKHPDLLICRDEIIKRKDFSIEWLESFPNIHWDKYEKNILEHPNISVKDYILYYHKKYNSLIHLFRIIDYIDINFYAKNQSLMRNMKRDNIINFINRCKNIEELLYVFDVFSYSALRQFYYFFDNFYHTKKINIKLKSSDILKNLEKFEEYTLVNLLYFVIDLDENIIKKVESAGNKINFKNLKKHKNFNLNWILKFPYAEWKLNDKNIIHKIPLNFIMKNTNSNVLIENITLLNDHPDLDQTFIDNLEENELKYRKFLYFDFNYLSKRFKISRKLLNYRQNLDTNFYTSYIPFLSSSCIKFLLAKKDIAENIQYWYLYQKKRIAKKKIRDWMFEMYFHPRKGFYSKTKKNLKNLKNKK